MNINFDFSTLRAACEHHLAREIARSRVKDNDGWQAWPRETDLALAEARVKINEMSNIELLELIGDTLAHA